MGWKTLKERYRISHIVSADQDNIYIGHINDFRLASIQKATGSFARNEDQSLIAEFYPALTEATDDDRKAAIETPDRHLRNIAVFSIENGRIKTHRCDHAGFPNPTHDGLIQHPGTFTSDHDEAVAWAKWELGYHINRVKESIDNLESANRGAQPSHDDRTQRDSLDRLSQQQQDYKAALVCLNRTYPQIEPKDADDEIEAPRLSFS